MSWTDPSTHIWAVGELVTASNMNTFIEANLASIGSYATSTQRFSGTVSSGGATSPTAFLTETGIASFPEAFGMIVTVTARAEAPTSHAVALAVHDELGSDITFGGPQTYSVISGDFEFVGCQGAKDYSPAGSAGFSVLYNVDSGVVNISGFVVVTFQRGGV